MPFGATVPDGFQVDADAVIFSQGLGEEDVTPLVLGPDTQCFVIICWLGVILTAFDLALGPRYKDSNNVGHKSMSQGHVI